MPIVRPRALPSPRAAISLAGAVAALALAVSSAAGSLPGEAPTPGPVPLADRLQPDTWAFAIPSSWLAAPIPGLRTGDVLDLVGVRASERATAVDIAAGVRVVSIDDRAVVVELTFEDASAVSVARARGLMILPVLRSSR